jgi:hypothetical protein
VAVEVLNESESHEAGSSRERGARRDVFPCLSSRTAKPHFRSMAFGQTENHPIFRSATLSKTGLFVPEKFGFAEAAHISQGQLQILYNIFFNLKIYTAA